MGKEKHIEEMMEAQCVFYGECETCPVYPTEDDRESKCRIGCRMLYNAGYRKQEWISVDERLPKLWEMVLVCCDDIISTDFIASTGRWYEHIDHTSVTHWMPLPAPPKGE